MQLYLVLTPVAVAHSFDNPVGENVLLSAVCLYATSDDAVKNKSNSYSKHLHSHCDIIVWYSWLYYIML